MAPLSLHSRVGVRASRAREIMRLKNGRSARRELLTVDYLLTLAAKLPRRDDLALRVSGDAASGTVYFGRESFAIDRIAFFGIFLERWYETDYRNAVVVDIGAHKGYFGAYALVHGAAAVHSYEPEASNFAALERAAGSFRRPWRPDRSAVGISGGTATLHVSSESAGHSLVHTEADGARRTVSAQDVPVTAMSDVLARARESAARVIVKIDAEGSECELVLGTAPADWDRVDTVFLEFHDFAACSSQDLIEALERSGFAVDRHVPDVGAELLALRRR